MAVLRDQEYENHPDRSYREADPTNHNPGYSERVTTLSAKADLSSCLAPEHDRHKGPRTGQHDRED